MKESDNMQYETYKYATGYNTLGEAGKPTEGDAVELTYNGYEGINKGSRGIVHLIRGAAGDGQSVTIRVKWTSVNKAHYGYVSNGDTSTFLKVSNFKLIKSAIENPLMTTDETSKSSGPKARFMILGESGSISGTALNSEMLETVVGKLLQRNPFDVYHVFEYRQTGKMPKVEVQWAIPALPAPVSSDETMFTKT
jgi:hypothetical protein